jgi:hypothetical protein
MHATGLRLPAGTLHRKHELYMAAKAMVARLDDRYSEFLDPAGFRAAIRRPTQAELDYLSNQAVGTPLSHAWHCAPDARVRLPCMHALLCAEHARSGTRATVGARW